MSLRWKRKRLNAEIILLPLALVVMSMVLVNSDWLTRWDDEFYDWQIRNWTRPAAADIVIVAIDEQSLLELGRWPWPRSIHARLVDELTAANAKVIGLDLMFSEPDLNDPGSDARLATALRDSNRVILPLAYGQIGGIGLAETVPQQELVAAAAGLGHVDLPLDGDGVNRGVFLKAGLGTPYWSFFALAMLEWAEPDRGQIVQVSKHKRNNFLYAWEGEQWFLTPYSGPPGHYQQVSYSDVLDGKPSGEFFRDKFVLVGVTAAGLGSSIATPVSAFSQPMSGVEINANVLDALRQGLMLQHFHPLLTMLITGLLVLLAILSYFYLRPRTALLCGGMMLLMTIVISALLLRVTHHWFPPSAALLVLVLSYPLWSWRRIETATHALFLEQERATVTLQSIADAVITTDSKHRVEYLNPVAEAMLGYTASEARGMQFDRVFRVVDEDSRAPLKFPIYECTNGNQPLILSESNLLVSSNGHEYNVHALATPIRDRRNHVTGIAITFSDVSERRRMTQQMHYQATHDALTQLPNRMLLHGLLEHSIERANRSGLSLAILFLDLDDFKKVNDGLGHTAGDLLLVKVVERVKACARKNDTFARLGGDEFIVLLEDLADEETVVLVARKILKVLEAPFQIQEREFVISASTGISFYPKDGNTPEILLQNADTAMYRAKESGRNNFQFYRNDMNTQVVKRISMEQNLRRALEEGELELYYQLQIATENKRLSGLECLLRWQQPGDAPISPREFIPLAEETGLIIPIGEWVIQTACKHARQWFDLDLPLPRVSINLSPRQFMQSGLTDMVNRALTETNLDSTYLGVEITESTIMKDIDSAVAILNVLKSMGVHLSIDDFGTGYSSLSYLKQFPVDQLKIDQSFVRNITTEPDDAAISQAIIAMAHSMKLSVIAEGVETQEQADFLIAKGCNEMQGYYFGRPIPFREMTTLLETTAIA